MLLLLLCVGVLAQGAYRWKGVLLAEADRPTPDLLVVTLRKNFGENATPFFAYVNNDCNCDFPETQFIADTGDRIAVRIEEDGHMSHSIQNTWVSDPECLGTCFECVCGLFLL